MPVGLCMSQLGLQQDACPRTEDLPIEVGHFERENCEQLKKLGIEEFKNC